MSSVRETRRKGDGNVTENASQKASPEKRREEVEKQSTDPRPETRTPPAGSASPPDAPARESASVVATVVLPTLQEAKAFAFTAGVAPDAAECWWHDCEARPSTPDGHYTDRDGNLIKNWRPHLISFGRRWQAHEALHRRRGSSPRGASSANAPMHANPDSSL